MPCFTTPPLSLLVQAIFYAISRENPVAISRYQKLVNFSKRTKMYEAVPIFRKSFLRSFCLTILVCLRHRIRMILFLADEN